MLALVVRPRTHNAAAQVHEVEEVEHEILQTRSLLTTAIYRYAMSEAGQALRQDLVNEEAQPNSPVSEPADSESLLTKSQPETNSIEDHWMHPDAETHIDEWHLKDVIVDRLFDAWCGSDNEIDLAELRKHLKSINFRVSRQKLYAQQLTATTTTDTRACSAKD
eukprot:COSAG01_NODE_1395_length_10476_cov_11.562331_7_plen_164_part_00